MSIAMTETITCEMLTTWFDRVPITLNPALVAQQGIRGPEVTQLLESHQQKQALFQRMRKAPEQDLPRLAREVDGLEYRQQSLWGFPLDARFHLWYEVPRCSCAKRANAAMRGHTGKRAIRQDCPVHGSFLSSQACGGDVPQEVRFRLAPSFGGHAVLVEVPENHVLVDVTAPSEAAAVLHFGEQRS